MNFDRQHQIFEPSKQRTKIHIIGAGSTGSFITLTLAKLGFENIKVTDFDKIEDVNIPNQFYRLSDVEKYKVDALKEIVKDFTGTEIETEKIKIDENYNFDLNIDSLIVFCLDNMETRKLIYEKVKEYPIKLIDTRMGGEGYQIYTTDLNNTEETKRFETALNGETKETECGLKSAIYTINSIASETTNIIKKIDKGEKYPRVIKREMKSYNIIGRVK